MIPENGRFVFISTLTLTASPAVVPLTTTHCIYGSASFTDEAGTLAIRFDGTNLNKVIVPLGEFTRIGNIIPGTSSVLTEGTAPASSVTVISFYRWEQS
jgi:hypothetical protein